MLCAEAAVENRFHLNEVIPMPFAVVALAAGVSFSSCAAEAVANPRSSALQEAMVRQVADNIPLSSSDEEVLAQVHGEAAACVARTGKHEAGATSGADLVVANLAEEAFAGRLKAAGVDMARLDAHLEAASLATLEALIAKRFEEPGVSQLASNILQAGSVSDSTAAHRRLIGAWAINAARRWRAAADSAH